MKTLILHAGVHKTGSTSIQQSLWRVRETLAAQGLGYLETEPNHSIALYSLFSRRAAQYHFNLRRGIEGAERLRRHNQRERAVLVRALSEVRTERLLVSAEDVCKLEPDELDALRAFLSEHAETIRVVLYLRPPRPWIASMAQQRLKKGWRLDQIVDDPPVPCYRTWVQTFQAVFGREAVHVRLYRRDAEAGWDVVDDFLEAVGLRLPQAPAERGPMNATMSVRAAEAIDALNRLYPTCDHAGRWNPERAHGAIRELVALGGPRVGIDIDLPARACAALAEDVAWVRRETGLVLDPDLPAEKGTPPRPHEPEAVELARVVNGLTLRLERAHRNKQHLRRKLEMMEESLQGSGGGDPDPAKIEGRKPVDHGPLPGTSDEQNRAHTSA